MDFVHPLAVDKVDSSEVIVNEGELGAVLGDGWEDTGYPEQPHILVRLWRLYLVKLLGDVTISTLHARAHDNVLELMPGIISKEANN